MHYTGVTLIDKIDYREQVLAIQSSRKKGWCNGFEKRPAFTGSGGSNPSLAPNTNGLPMRYSQTERGFLRPVQNSDCNGLANAMQTRMGIPDGNESDCE